MNEINVLVPIQWKTNGESYCYTAERRFVIAFAPAISGGGVATWGTPEGEGELNKQPEYWGASREGPSSCRTFAAWSSALANPAPAEFKVDVTVHSVPGQTGKEWKFRLHVRAFGGPIKVELDRKAHPLTFELDMNWSIDEQAPTKTKVRPLQYPRYLTNFNYNPATTTGHGYPSFSPIDTQGQNLFRVRLAWAQPTNTNVWFTTAKGILVLGLKRQNQTYIRDTGIYRSEGTEALYHATKAIRVKDYPMFLVGCSGEAKDVDARLVATYTNVEEAYYNYPPIGAEDDTHLSYPKLGSETDEHLKLTMSSYSTFSVRTPTDVEKYVPASPDVEQAPEGSIRKVFIYRLTENKGNGMPGIWIQERFKDGVPSGFLTNNVLQKWITQRKFGMTTGVSGDPPDVYESPLRRDGVMNHPDYIGAMFWYLQQHGDEIKIENHEYWAGAQKTWPNYMYGVHVATFRIIIIPTDVKHERVSGNPSGGGGGGGSG